MSTNSEINGASTQVVALIGSIMAKLAKWDLNLFKWFEFLNQLRKDQVVGLVNGDYKILPYVKKRKREHSLFNVWRTLKPMQLPNKSSALIRMIEKAGFCILPYGRAALEVHPMEAVTVELDLVVTNALELGLELQEATAPNIYKKAQQIGLELCPASVGPMLRLQYPDQPAGEQLRIASAVMKDPENPESPWIFDVDHGSGDVYLGVDCHTPNELWGSMNFVFVLPRRKRA